MRVDSLFSASNYCELISKWIRFAGKNPLPVFDVNTDLMKNSLWDFSARLMKVIGAFKMILKASYLLFEHSKSPHTKLIAGYNFL
jgi:hypothetical protein